MKRVIAAACLALTGAAWANGPYDGLYQTVTDQKSFLMVQQNGPQVLVTNYFAIPTTGGVAFYYGNVTVKPSEVLIWNAFMGQLQGNKAIITGLMVNMMCDTAFEVTFNGPALSAKLLQAVQTKEGAAQGVPCGSLLPVGTTITANRVF
jgi:hypothetical protein